MIRFNPETWNITLPGIDAGERTLALRVPRVGLPFLKSRPLLEWAFWGSFLLYSVLCVWIYFTYVAPWIDGSIITRIGADSDRYWEAVREGSSYGAGPLISTTGNLLGPVSLGLILHNGLNVMCFNFFIFGLSMFIARSIPGLDKGLFGYLMLFNAELLPTLTTLNKEIFVLLASVMTAKYLYSKRPSTLGLLGVIGFSVFARWEAAAVLILYLLLNRFFFRGHPKRAIVSLVALITFIYPIAFRLLGIDESTFDWLLGGAHTIIKLNSIQNAFGFPLVVLPKIAMEIAGTLASVDFYKNNVGIATGFTDPQQEIFQPLGCLALIIVLAYALWTRRLNLNRPIATFVLFTLIITAASPFIQPRYLYGIYVILCVDLARPNELYIHERQ